MATFNPVVSTYVKKNSGTRNVQILCTHVCNNKTLKKYIATNIFVTKDDTTRSGKVKNQEHKDTLNAMISTCVQRCNKYAHEIGNWSIERVVDLVIDVIQGKNRGDDELFRLDIMEYGRALMKDSKSYKNYNTAFNNLSDFLGRDRLDVNEVTSKLIRDWVEYIRTMPAQGVKKKRTKGNRAESLYVNSLKKVFLKAKEEFNDEDNMIIRIPFSPFAKVEVQKHKPLRKRAITVKQIRDLAKIAYQDDPASHGTSRFNLGKDVFLLSFGLIGMNSIDLFYCNELKAGRINYNRSKTKDRREDLAEFSVKVQPEILPLVEKYKDPTGERVFNFYKLYATPDSFNQALNSINGLKEIGKRIGEKDLQFYAARHTWATIATNDVGLDKYLVHDCLNHVDEKMKSTDRYIKKDWKRIDRANRQVLDFVNLGGKSKGKK
jgi:integrase